jgi:patatin-like phospholipase/acyl hydrolase
LITSMLTTPLDDSDKQKPVCTAKDVVQFYLWYSAQIFPHTGGPFSESRLNFRALNGPKYKSSGLERILNKYFPGEPHLSTALTSVVIPAFDTKLQQPVFFSSWRVGVCCNAIFEFLPGPSSPCCLFFSPLKFIFFFEFLA